MKNEETKKLDKDERKESQLKVTVREDGTKEYDGHFETFEQFDEFFMDDDTVFKL